MRMLFTKGPNNKHKLAKDRQGLTGKQKSRPKVAKWKTRNKEIEGSFY